MIRKLIKYFLLAIFIFLVILFFVRLFSAKQLDDVSPDISCEKELLEKADIYFVIPDFNNNSIANNSKWCKEILAMNKTLGLHGVYHTYEEFNQNISEEYLQKGMSDFESCFGFKPEIFRPSQVAISKENKKLIKKYMKLDNRLNYVTHKVYHCGDTGVPKNWISDLI